MPRSIKILLAALIVATLAGSGGLFAQLIQGSGSSSIGAITANQGTAGNSASPWYVILPADVPVTGAITGAYGLTCTTPGVQQICTGTPTGTTAAYSVVGDNAITVTIAGTFSQTITAYASNDNGATLIPIQGQELLNNSVNNCSSTFTAPISDVYFNLTGMTNFYLAASTFSSGTANITAIASGNVGPLSGCATSISTSPSASATGGATNYGPLYSAASTNATNVKSSAGTLYSITVTQSTTTAMELKLYNLSSSPTCSSATGIVDNIPIPSNATSPGFHLTYPVGRAFSTGIGFCLVAFGNPAGSTDNSNAVTGATVSMTYE